MRRASKDIIETTLRNDPTVDNRLIGPALDAANGKTAAQMMVADLDTILSRTKVAELLDCSSRTVDKLGKAKILKRVKLRKTDRRAKGYSAKSVRDFMAKAVMQ